MVLDAADEVECFGGGDVDTLIERISLIACLPFDLKETRGGKYFHVRTRTGEDHFAERRAREREPVGVPADERQPIRAREVCGCRVLDAFYHIAVAFETDDVGVHDFVRHDLLLVNKLNRVPHGDRKSTRLNS